jgi:phage gp46-like protein
MNTGDALFEACPDGGDITLVDGLIARTGGIPGAVYISIMGGNDDDDGRPGAKEQYWGNALEADETRHIRSRTATILIGLPMTALSLRAVEAAALQDLAWMTTTGVASEIRVTASIRSPNWLVLRVEVDGESFEFRLNWEAQT